MNEELKITWLYRLKRRLLGTILVFLAASISLTMVFIALKLRTTLVDDSRMKTRELSTIVRSNLRHLMITRTPGMIQDTLEKMADDNQSIVKTFILDNTGRIAHSSDPAEVGTVPNRFEEESCRLCHTNSSSPKRTTVFLDVGGSVQRNVTLIYNEKDCHGCHSPSNAINGKLIIDRSLATTDSLITAIELIIFGSGVICLVILIPFFSRVISKGIDRYIVEIFQRNEELRLLYVMVERLSKTLDLELLREIVSEIFRDILDADSVTLVLPKGKHEYSTSRWDRTRNRVERLKIADDDPVAETVRSWNSGEFNGSVVRDDRRQVSMGIRRGGHRLALIVADRNADAFDETRLKLVEVIRGHIAVALENARLYHMAITDELTGLFTKRHFRQCIDREFSDFQEYGTRLSLLMVDLDDFKQVNDVHGHVVGDTVLKEVGQRILLSIRENDLAFRYGGEEFAVILPDTGVKGGQHVAERIREAIGSGAFEPGTLDLSITTSIGLSTCPGPASIRELIVAADRALYEGKRTGKDKVVIAGDSPGAMA